jgi:anaerobic magnesium-protoporphyrin IX monomethyl ester cyclase
MIDCLIIGQADVDFESHLRTIRFSFGQNSGAYQDQDLTFITHQGKPYRILDFLNLVNRDRLDTPLTNTDFLWPTILVLGSFLNKHGLTFDYVNQYRLEIKHLREKLATNKYRTVAITTTLYVTDAPIREIIAEIRKTAPDTRIVLGGPYIKNRFVENSPDRIAAEFGAVGGDVYVNSSEGPLALTRLIQAMRDGRPFASIPNLVYSTTLEVETCGLVLPSPVPAGTLSDGSPDLRTYVGNGYAFTSLETEYNTLEENPINYDLFTPEEIGSFVSIATAKSCPYKCSFCGFPARAGAYTYLDVDTVEAELRRVKKLGVETITFLDDTFNVPKKRFKELLRMMIRNKFGFKWNSFYRSDQGDEEAIELMAESGCEGVFLGIESASDKMLELMEKTSRKKHYEAAIPLLRKNGIYSHANFIVGFPGETEKTAYETMQFIKDLKPDTYKAQLWYADNTSPIWARREEFGIEGAGFSWSHKTMNSDEATRLVDVMYQEIIESAFLPQDGFGMWCIFYLQRRGMTRQEVLDFLQGWSVEVRRKRLDPTVREAPVATIRKLRQLGRIRGIDTTRSARPRVRATA